MPKTAPSSLAFAIDDAFRTVTMTDPSGVVAPVVFAIAIETKIPHTLAPYTRRQFVARTPKRAVRTIVFENDPDNSVRVVDPETGRVLYRGVDVTPAPSTPATETPATETPAKAPAGPRFTTAVRRGLDDVSAIVRASFDASAPPSETIVSRWGATRTREFNLALAWIEAKTADIPPRELSAKR